MAHSADGDWFWNGTAWIPARSPDRAWWWDGSRWVPSGVLVPVRLEYQPTAWTRRLQLIIVGLLLVGLLFSAFTVPALMSGTFQQSIDRSIASQPATDPASVAQLRQMITGVMTGALVVAGVFTVAFYAVILVGTWKLWRWVYWYFVVAGVFSAIGVLQNVVYLTGAGTYPLPSWYLIPGIVSGLAWVALAVWMIVLYRRHGTWARDRVPVGGGSQTGS
jgi:hypothetical protein